MPTGPRGRGARTLDLVPQKWVSPPHDVRSVGPNPTRGVGAPFRCPGPIRMPVRMPPGSCPGAVWMQAGCRYPAGDAITHRGGGRVPVHRRPRCPQRDGWARHPPPPRPTLIPGPRPRSPPISANTAGRWPGAVDPDSNSHRFPWRDYVRHPRHDRGRTESTKKGARILLRAPFGLIAGYLVSRLWIDRTAAITSVSTSVAAVEATSARPTALPADCHRATTARSSAASACTRSAW